MKKLPSIFYLPINFQTDLLILIAPDGQIASGTQAKEKSHVPTTVLWKSWDNSMYQYLAVTVWKFVG